MATSEPVGTTVAYRIDITGTADVNPGGIPGRKLVAIRRYCQQQIETGGGLQPAGPVIEHILSLVEARDVEV